MQRRRSLGRGGLFALIVILAAVGGWSARGLLTDPQGDVSLRAQSSDLPERPDRDDDAGDDDEEDDDGDEDDDDAEDDHDEDDDDEDDDDGEDAADRDSAGTTDGAAPDRGDGGRSAPPVPPRASRPRARRAYLSPIDSPRAVVWAVGDGANGSARSRAVVATMRRGPVDRFLYLGDVYDWDGPAQFAQRYGSVYGPLARVTAPTVGNHESDVADGYDLYWARLRGSAPPGFYSFTVSGWEVLSLNSEVDHTAASAQVRWLRGRLHRPGTCRIAFWHRPRFSAGTEHGDQEDVEPLWHAVQGRAAIVINGHEHDMQRLRPIAGTVEFVSGAGGESHYPVRRDDPRVAFADDGSWGALRLELSPGRAAFAFVTSDGHTLDAGSIPCRG